MVDGLECEDSLELLILLPSCAPCLEKYINFVRWVCSDQVRSAGQQRKGVGEDTVGQASSDFCHRPPGKAGRGTGHHAW